MSVGLAVSRRYRWCNRERHVRVLVRLAGCADASVAPQETNVTLVTRESRRRRGRAPVNLLAFGQPAEADLSRSCGMLVATRCRSSLWRRSRRVGCAYSLYSGRRRKPRPRISVWAWPRWPFARLASPGHWIGTRAPWTELLNERGCPFVVVVGHPQYDPRFGFELASRHGLVSQWDGMPDVAFMVLILDQPAMAGVHGVAGTARVRRIG